IFDITINTPKLQTADPKVFESLEEALENFLNNRKWTEDVYEQEERIKCKVQLTIRDELSATSFNADLAIQATRPVFGSSYETALLSHVDKDVTFSYEPFQPLVYAKNTYNDNLTSIMAFYVYIILAMDYDSFSAFGGEPYYQIAQDIMTNIPPNVASNNPGWRSLDGNRNRYWIIESVLSPTARPYRQAMYDYHRLSLDKMSDDTDKARAKMAKALEALDGVRKNYPNAMILQMFANAKSSEIIEIFKKSPQTEKSRVYQIMTKLDAANAAKYREMGI
ncbi:MAG: DUF4835 family protein, partial [Saprospiraceae bacterium]